MRSAKLWSIRENGPRRGSRKYKATKACLANRKGLARAKTFGERSQTNTISAKSSSVLTQLGKGTAKELANQSAKTTSTRFTRVSASRITLKTARGIFIRTSYRSAEDGSSFLQRSICQ